MVINSSKLFAKFVMINQTTFKRLFTIFIADNIFKINDSYFVNRYIKKNMSIYFNRVKNWEILKN